MIAFVAIAFAAVIPSDIMRSENRCISGINQFYFEVCHFGHQDYPTTCVNGLDEL